jgi:hypothetical protein
MRKRLQLKWMLTASTLLATSFTLPGVARAAAGNDTSRGIATNEEKGRTIYGNDDAPAREPQPAPRGAGFDSRLLEEQRESLEACASANTGSGKAPSSAAAEVSEFYRRDSVPSANAKLLQANSHGHQATPQEIDQSGIPHIVETQDDVGRITHL